jgi:hypothetical protein
LPRTASSAVGPVFGPSCGWLLRLEYAGETGIARCPARVGSAVGMEPRRQLLPRIEDATTPDDPRNRVDRRRLYGARGLERVCHPVPRNTRCEQGERRRYEQKQDLYARRAPYGSPAANRSSTAANWFGPAARRRRIRRSRRQWKRYVVPRLAPRREDVHPSIVEPNGSGKKPSEGRALGGRFV